MDIVEGTRIPLKVAGFPVGYADVIEVDGVLAVRWEAGESILPLAVVDYEVEQ